MLAKSLLAAFVLTLFAAAPAAADSYVIASYGTGMTKCQFKVTLTRPLIVMWGSDENWDFKGTTTCDKPVQQTGQAFAVGGESWDSAPPGSLCSQLSTTCVSSGDASGRSFDHAEYKVKLIAPPGEGWHYVAYPYCQGSGTDNLTCTFKGDAIYRNITW